MEHANTAKKISKKWILWMLCGLFLIPSILGTCLYLFREELSFQTIAKGDLMPPLLAQEVPGLNLKCFMGKWNLVYFSPMVCNSTCEMRKKILNNICIALGKDNKRIQMQFLAYHSVFGEKNIKLPVEGMTEGSLLIIDPRGWLVLHYPPEKFYGKAVLEDLRRLLRFSYVG